MKKTIKIRNLDCAHCAAELERELSEIVDVTSVNVSFVDQKIYLEYLSESALTAVKAHVQGFEDVEIVEENVEENRGTFKESDGKVLLRVENLHCAACALDLQDELLKIKGIEEAQVDFLTQTILLKGDDEGIRKAVKKANQFENVHVIDGERYALACSSNACSSKACSSNARFSKASSSRTKEKWQIFISAICFVLGIICKESIRQNWAEVVGYVLYALAYLSVGYPVLISTAKNILKGKVFDENFLMTVASIGAIALGQYDEAVAVMLLYQIGEFLQGVAVGSSRNSISELMQLKSERAFVLKNGEYIEIPPKELEIGDVVLVKGGERIPADGVLLSENAVLDVKSLTGESELRFAKQGEEVLSGSINSGGVFEISVARRYEDSAVGRILELVENATAKKAAPEKFITKFARYYTPIVCSLALIMALIVPLFIGRIVEGAWGYYEFSRWLQTALTFLVISCPCALIISVPLTYFSGIGACAKQGILVKGGVYLDELSKAKIFAFDKTGTLTEGCFELGKICATQGVTENELLNVIAALENKSSHPIASAFSKINSTMEAVCVQEILGKGIQGEVCGEIVLVGSAEFLKENGVQVEEFESVYTVVHAARSGNYLGSVEIGDKIRANATATIQALKSIGDIKTVMLTGDKEARAWKISQSVGITDVHAERLPDQKLQVAEQLKREGGLVYVGDGINDAPVMKVADCSVSMGKLGSAAAVEASDIVLISDDLSGVGKAYKIAKKTRKIVLQNIIFAVVMKIGFMVLGVVGVLPLWLAVFADVGVMLLAVLNSFRVRKSV